MILNSLVALFTLLALVVGDDRISQYTIGKDTLIISSGSAITDQSLVAKGIKTLSSNGNELIMYSPSCEVNVRSLDDLDGEVKTLLSDAKTRLSSQGSLQSTFGLQRNSPSTISIGEANGGPTFFGVNLKNVAYIEQNRNNIYTSDSRISFGHMSGFSSFNFNGFSMSKLSENSYSFTNDNLPNGLVRTFVHVDVVAFVYEDGRVHMKPEVCLNSDEQQILLSLKKAFEEEEKRFKVERQQEAEKMEREMSEMSEDMAKMHQELSEMEEQMARDMEEMEREMREML